MKEMTLQELHEVQLAMLDAVDNYCRLNHLRYSLGGGTLLGAVRHHGYIPWDDDIDIMMPRPDYEKFMRYFKHEYYKLYDYRTDDTCGFSFAKLIDTRTIVQEYTITYSVFIDIFPIDGLPAPKDLPLYLEKLNKLKCEISVSIRTTRGNWISNMLKNIIKKCLYRSRKTIVKDYDAFLQKYNFNTSKFAGAIVGRYGEKELMFADVFKHYVELPFENRQYQCIADYDSYLKKHYGNYMQLPPKDQQVANHSFKAYWK